MAFTKNTDDMNIIRKLDDEPNDVGGLTASQLKTEFDKAGVMLQDFINDHIDELGAASAAGNIGFTSSTAIQANNVQSAIETVQQQVAEATTGEIPDGGLLNAKLGDGAAAGWEDVTDDVNLALDTEPDGTYIKSASISNSAFRFSRTLGILAYRFSLTVNITRAETIDINLANYLSDNFCRYANVGGHAVRPADVSLYTLSGATTFRADFNGAFTGSITVYGWYFCDGE